MNNFQELKKDLIKNEELRQALKKALGSDNIEVPAERYAEIVAFGAEHGYEFTEEDIHFDHAANRDLSEDELKLVSAGGWADLVQHDNTCDHDYYCYLDFGCDVSQRVYRPSCSWGAKPTWSRGMCIADYACAFAYNSCAIANECTATTSCRDAAV